MAAAFFRNSFGWGWAFACAGVGMLVSAAIFLAFGEHLRDVTHAKKHGTAGFEATGMWMEDWPHANQRQISIDAYERLIAARRPLVTVRDAWVDSRKLSYEIMHLPLSEDGARISMIVTAIGPR